MVPSSMEKVCDNRFWILLVALWCLQLASHAQEPVHTNVYRNQFDKNIELDMWSHIRRIVQTHANGYKVTSSAMGKKEFPNDPIGAAADGYVPDDSNLQTVPRFTWSPNKGSEEWLQYDFPEPKTISQAEVFWFEPFKDRSLLPTEWKVSYRSKAGKWKAVETKDRYEITPDKFNRVNFKPVEATAVRLTVQLPEGEGGGVYEFRVSDKKVP